MKEYKTLEESFEELNKKFDPMKNELEKILIFILDFISKILWKMKIK